jgi:hypothetical protein
METGEDVYKFSRLIVQTVKMPKVKTEDSINMFSK